MLFAIHSVLDSYDQGKGYWSTADPGPSHGFWCQQDRGPAPSPDSPLPANLRTPSALLSKPSLYTLHLVQKTSTARRPDCSMLLIEYSHELSAVHRISIQSMAGSFHNHLVFKGETEIDARCICFKFLPSLGLPKWHPRDISSGSGKLKHHHRRTYNAFRYFLAKLVSYAKNIRCLKIWSVSQHRTQICIHRWRIVGIFDQQMSQWTTYYLVPRSPSLRFWHRWVFNVRYGSYLLDASSIVVFLWRCWN